MTLTDSPGAIRVPQPSGRTRRGPTSAASHAARDAHTSFAGGTEFPDAIACPSPNPAPHRGPKTAVSRDRGDAQMLPAGGADIPDAVGHPQSMARSRPGADTAAPATKQSAAAEPLSGPSPVLLDDPFLYLAAAVLDDAEKVRTANANRLRILTTPADQEDEDGVPRGWGLTLDHPDVARVAALVSALEKVEHDATLNLQRLMRKHPLGPWVKAQVGVGEKQAARLLACIGDPYWNTLHDRPRTVSQLWAYSGLHVLPASQAALAAQSAPAGGGQTGSDPDHRSCEAHPPTVLVAAKRRKGIRANWSTDAKMRAYLIATSCIKQARSPYRAVYDGRRARTAETHPEWTPGHSHNDALRIVSKAILKDLWLAARDLHQAAGTEVAA
jgi:hypothetical protein